MDRSSAARQHKRLDSLTETEIEHDGKRVVLRSPLRRHLALRAADVTFLRLCAKTPTDHPIPQM